MNWRDVLPIVAAFLLGFVVTWLVITSHEPQHTQVKWRTHYETVDRTVPGPERTIPGPETTVFKRKSGVTTWIIVCGKKETTVRGNKPFDECNLPNTGP